MTLLFRDKFDRIIRLPNERIRHIGVHMDLRDKLYLLELTLLYPDFLLKDEGRVDVFYYQKYLKDKHLYFIVVVKVFNGEGFILTIFNSDKLQQ